jgi:hypothetical protein
MNETRRCALEQLRAFLEGTGESGSSPSGTEEGRYSHLQALLKRFTYPPLKLCTWVRLRRGQAVGVV